MKEAEDMSSPHVSAPKTKHESFFPKIHRPNHRETSRQIVKSTAKANYLKNDTAIKLIKNQKGQYQCQYDKHIPIKRNQSQVEEILIKQSKDYRELQNSIQEMTRKFNAEMAELERKKQENEGDIKRAKQDVFDSKLGLWQLKNDNINLEEVIKQEQQEYSYLLQQLGYGVEEQDSQSDGQQGPEFHPFQ